MFWIRVQGCDAGELLATAELLGAAAAADGKQGVASPVPMAAPAEALCAIDTAGSAAGESGLIADGLIAQDPGAWPPGHLCAVEPVGVCAGELDPWVWRSRR